MRGPSKASKDSQGSERLDWLGKQAEQVEALKRSAGGLSESLYGLETLHRLEVSKVVAHLNPANRLAYQQSLAEEAVAGRSVASNGSITYTDQALVARNKLAESLLPFVLAAARSRLPANNPSNHLADFYCEGNLVLLKAIDSWAPEKTPLFITYLGTIVYQRLTDVARSVFYEQGWSYLHVRQYRNVTTALDRFMLENGRKASVDEIQAILAKRGSEILTQKFGREPTRAELSRAGWWLTEKRIQYVLARRNDYVPQNSERTPVAVDLSSAQLSFETAPATFDTNLELREEKAILVEKIKRRLSDSEKIFISDRFNLSDDPNLPDLMTFSTLGQKYGITRQAAQQRLQKILQKLRR